MTSTVMPESYILGQAPHEQTPPGVPGLGAITNHDSLWDRMMAMCVGACGYPPPGPYDGVITVPS
jgi:hypothetical protein